MTATDDSLIVLRKFAQGDRSAFSVLYQRYGAFLYRYLLSLVGEKMTAEDLLQETFSRLYQNPESLDKVEHPKAFLLACAKHQALMCLRRGARGDAILRNEYLELRDQAPSPMSADNKDRCSQIQAVLLDLPVDQREAVTLHLFEGMSFREAADVAGVSQNTLASRYRLALKKLRDLLT